VRQEDGERYIMSSLIIVTHYIPWDCRLAWRENEAVDWDGDRI
jgi:hypothetical protein